MYVWFKTGLLASLIFFVSTAKARGLGEVSNWDYLIGISKFGPEETEAVLNYAAGRCDATRKVTRSETVSHLQIKSRRGHLSHITLELFSIPDKPDNLVKRLAAAGTKSICYFSGGSLNTDRPQDKPWAAIFDKLKILGPPVRKFSEDYRSECFERHRHSRIDEKIADDHCYWGDNRWIIPSENQKLKEYFTERIKMCASRGFVAIEADNVDAFSQVELEGIAEKSANLKMLKMISSICQDNKMVCGLKNSGSVANAIGNLYSFAVVERCRQFNECDTYKNFSKVLAIEYDNGPLPHDPKFTAVSRGESEMSEILPLIVQQCGSRR